MDVAMRRARLWEMNDSDLYKKVFITAHQTEGSWAWKSAAALHEWGIADSPVWLAKGGKVSLEAFKEYVECQVERKCSGKWRSAAGRHTLPIPYLDWRTAPNIEFREGDVGMLSWPNQIAQRAVCRLRAGLIRLGHVNMASSSANKQNCIYCGTLCSSLHFHVLSRCAVWLSRRQHLWTVIGRMPPSTAEQLRVLFALEPGDGEAYHIWLSWAKDLDQKARHFWGGEN